MYNVCHIHVINYQHESVQKLNKPLLQTILYILYDTHVHRYFVYMHSNLYKSLVRSHHSDRTTYATVALSGLHPGFHTGTWHL